MNYVILKQFLSNRDCNSLIANTNHFNDNRPLGLIDGDSYNTWHTSKRSLGLEYRYQNDTSTMSLQQGIKKELSSIVPIDFSGGVNELCLPFCKYLDNGIIKVHRDIDKVGNNSVEYLVVCMLTQIGEDYSDRMRDGDQLFINYHYDLVSEDGKEVFESPKAKIRRFYPNLNKGDVIIFKNSNSIHGVDPITVKDGQLGRITCGFRSK